ncbi:head GIN domain-containing protein [Alteraurantiacibacter buctensis]|uniref:DUF2807 domain-containing protein n=1 Tax=Alteraurantiacibacter buctensis TaxID=1503981 RepID=A0A844YUI4_9SPHN|nr:head GIN domain-containing protein [Alteraurantiacibacter buctensis]MXO70538.1 DUF2807 domain-containing protein [Alteraurantiacibacter buctensis]
MPRERPRLSPREIAFALAAGALAAGGAALVLDDQIGPDREERREERGAEEITFNLRDFTQVAVAGPQDVEITLGDGFSVTAYGDPDGLNLVEAVVEDGVLMLRPRDGISFGESLEDVRFAVTLPAITRVSVDGSGDVTLDRAQGDSFEGAIGGSGTLVIAQLEVTRASLTVNGAGDLDAEGTAGDVAVTINGSGQVHAEGLRADRATVDISGSGEVDLTALETAEVAIMGSAEVDISGSAVCSVTQVGSGEVRCEGGGGNVAGPPD